MSTMDQSLFENEGITEEKEDKMVAMTPNDDEELDNNYSNSEKEPISDDVMSHDKSIEDIEEGPTTSGAVVSDAPPPQSPTTSDNPFLIDEQSDEEGTTSINKRSHSVDSEERDDEQEPSEKRPRLASNDSEGEGDDQDELEAELADLQPQEDEVIVDKSIPEGNKESSDSEVEDKKDPGVSDFDLMMQRRKEAMARARRRRKRDIDITTNDDHILAMIKQMKEAAEEDRALNLQQKAAVKKIQMLPTIVDHLKKADLITTFIECGICPALADWLKPLPDHSLPHLKIRESILDTLKSFPPLDGHLLKTSGLGKAVMLIYRHPKEIKRNREKAGKLINMWARPVFGLTSDFKALSRDEREERDWAHLSQAARRRLSSGSGESSQITQDEAEPQKPGDKGWIGRARVPMPSHKDYVVRPKWNIQHDISKGSSKKVLNRYEKQVQKKRDKSALKKNTHAVAISIEGRKMPL